MRTDRLDSENDITITGRVPVRATRLVRDRTHRVPVRATIRIEEPVLAEDVVTDSVTFLELDAVETVSSIDDPAVEVATLVDDADSAEWFEHAAAASSTESLRFFQDAEPETESVAFYEVSDAPEFAAPGSVEVLLDEATPAENDLTADGEARIEREADSPDEYDAEPFDDHAAQDDAAPPTSEHSVASFAMPVPDAANTATDAAAHDSTLVADDDAFGLPTIDDDESALDNRPVEDEEPSIHPVVIDAGTPPYDAIPDREVASEAQPSIEADAPVSAPSTDDEIDAAAQSAPGSEDLGSEGPNSQAPSDESLSNEAPPADSPLYDVVFPSNDAALSASAPVAAALSVSEPTSLHDADALAGLSSPADLPPLDLGSLDSAPSLATPAAVPAFDAAPFTTHPSSLEADAFPGHGHGHALDSIAAANPEYADRQDGFGLVAHIDLDVAERPVTPATSGDSDAANAFGLPTPSQAAQAAGAGSVWDFLDTPARLNGPAQQLSPDPLPGLPTPMAALPDRPDTLSRPVIAPAEPQFAPPPPARPADPQRPVPVETATRLMPPPPPVGGSGGGTATPGPVPATRASTQAASGDPDRELPRRTLLFGIGGGVLFVAVLVAVIVLN